MQAQPKSESKFSLLGVDLPRNAAAAANIRAAVQLEVPTPLDSLVGDVTFKALLRHRVGTVLAHIPVEKHRGLAWGCEEGGKEK